MQHAIGWSVPFLLSLYVSRDIENSFSNVLLGMSLFLLITYTNFYLLRFFTQKKYFLYAVLALILVLVISAFATYIHTPASKFIINLNILTTVTILTTGLKFIKKAIIDQYEIQNLKAKQTQTEYNLLKAQVNPHFLFNTLNNLYALSLKKADELPDMLLGLSDLMRYQLDSSKEERVSLEKEIRYLENYINLERLRVKNNSMIKFNVSGYVLDKKVAPLLFIPFIENAFKYGISASKENLIIVDFKIFDNELNFTVKNNVSKTQENSYSGIGIENVKARLNILYKNKHDLAIVEKDNVFIVNLKLKLDFIDKR